MDLLHLVFIELVQPIVILKFVPDMVVLFKPFNRNGVIYYHESAFYADGSDF